MQAAQQGASASGGTHRRETTTNYEVDKTVRVTRNATGTVKRLNAAVVVNNRSVTDAKGKTTQVALSGDELEKLTALVKETIGFSAERGDSVKLINAPFKADKPEVDTTPLWQRPETLDLLRNLAMPGALTLLACIVVFGAIRPALKAAQAPKAGQRLDALVDDVQALPTLDAPAMLEAPGVDRRLEHARSLAKDNPAAMAHIVRTWVSREA
jgi:flagellar M-ring protein FliF